MAAHSTLQFCPLANPSPMGVQRKVKSEYPTVDGGGPRGVSSSSFSSGHLNRSTIFLFFEKRSGERGVGVYELEVVTVISPLGGFFKMMEWKNPGSSLALCVVGSSFLRGSQTVSLSLSSSFFSFGVPQRFGLGGKGRKSGNALFFSNFSCSVIFAGKEPFFMLLTSCFFRRRPRQQLFSRNKFPLKYFAPNFGTNFCLFYFPGEKNRGNPWLAALEKKCKQHRTTKKVFFLKSLFSHSLQVKNFFFFVVSLP